MDTKQLTLKYNKPVPRYTSYPTAPHFHSGVNGDVYAEWLSQIPAEQPVSVYVHIPFCQTLCYYCGCNTRITNNGAAMHHYCTTLMHEIEMVTTHVGKRLNVAHLQWGGGTPSYIAPDDFLAITALLKQKFNLLPNAEFSVEIDPRSLKKEMVTALAQAGVNRVSFGVQDFNPEVQKAVNRIQPYSMTEQAVNWLREAGISRINLDLMYGLPLQTVASIEDSVRLAASLNPDRLALFGYAHVPWMKKHQQVLEQYPIPNEQVRYEQFVAATNALEKAGFHAVGIDHFAKEDDPLWIAKQNGTLKRNFQGYTVDQAETLIAFGASAISCLPGGYAQNSPSTKVYQMLLNDNRLPVHKGIATSAEDKLRRAIIMELMCHHRADLNMLTTEIAMGGVETALPDAFSKMATYINDGLVRVDNGVVELTEPNHAVARLVASCFDTYFADDGTKHAQAV